MGKIQASEFKNETKQLFENIKSSLSDLYNDSNDQSAFYKHYLHWHEVKSLASLFSLPDISEVSFAVETLFDQVTQGEVQLSDIDPNGFNDSLTYIEASLNNTINNESKELDLEGLLKKIHSNSHGSQQPQIQPPVFSVENDLVQSGQNNHTPKVLIVEDEPVNLTLLEANISNFNSDIQITSVDSAEEGLFHFFTNKFDLIFLDIMMPIIDGNDFIAIIDKNIKEKNIPAHCNIVVQTAIQSMEQLTALAKKECVQEIIRKPIPPERIDECITRYCIEPYQ